MNGDRPATVDDRRRLSIADGMIAVAAVAVGLVLARETLPFPGPPGPGDVVRQGLALVTEFLAPASIAIFAIRLRPPRPAFRRLARRPGFAECLAASTSCILVAILLSIDRALNRRMIDVRSVSVILAFSAGFAVLGAWTTLVATGRWRPSAPGGVERLGRLVGWAWLAILAMEWILMLTVH